MEHGHWVCDVQLPEFANKASLISILEKPAQQYMLCSLEMDRLDSVGRGKVLFKDGVIYEFATRTTRKARPDDRMQNTLRIPFTPLRSDRMEKLLCSWQLIERFYAGGGTKLNEECVVAFHEIRTTFEVATVLHAFTRKPDDTLWLARFVCLWLSAWVGCRFSPTSTGAAAPGRTF
jgi:hypothetical protein